MLKVIQNAMKNVQKWNWIIENFYCGFHVNDFLNKSFLTVLRLPRSKFRDR